MEELVILPKMLQSRPRMRRGCEGHTIRERG
jgi:hypothetical protein